MSEYLQEPVFCKAHVYGVPWRDRLRHWLCVIECFPTALSVRHLSKALQKDNGFAISWHANIAMPIFDGAKGKLTIDEANAIADTLMMHLFKAKATFPK